MYSYPVVIHFHRKMGIMMLVHSVENRQMLKKICIMKMIILEQNSPLQSQVQKGSIL